LLLSFGDERLPTANNLEHFRLRQKDVNKQLATICPISISPIPNEHKGKFTSRDDDWFIAWLQDLCVRLARIEVSSQVSLDETQNRIARMQTVVNELQQRQITDVLSLRSLITSISANSDISGTAILKRKPVTIVNKVRFEWRIRSRVRVLFIWGNVEDGGSPTQGDMCSPSYIDSTPKFWQYRTETIPTKVGVNRYVAHASSMTALDWAALAPGVTRDTFPFAFDFIHELPPTSCQMLIADPPTASQFRDIPYLRTNDLASIGKLIISGIVAIADAIPQTGGAAGAVSTFLDGLTGIFSSFSSTDTFTASPPPSGSSPIIDWYQDSDSLTLTSEDYYTSITGTQTLNAGVPDGVLLSTLSGRTADGPLVTNVDVGPLGGSECAFRALFESNWYEQTFDNTRLPLIIPNTGPGVPGLDGGFAQYAVDAYFNRPTERALDGTVVSGYTLTFIDDRPYAWFDGVNWIERPELLND
jgi:hypothetical protein